MRDLETRKEKIFRALDEIEADMKTLSLRIIRAREELVLVRTEEDAKIYDERNADLEEGLVHIRLF